MEIVYLAIVLAPLIAAAVAGLFGRTVGRAGAHWITIGAVGLSFVLSLVVLFDVFVNDAPVYNATVYRWALVDGLALEVGFLIDQLSAIMIAVVAFVSLMVHVYTVGYMHEDPGYQRFFSYISLFTFAMLMLVMSNNFLQLFFGWEAVGLVSYLLIGFWFRKPTAIAANLKAFLVNRVGDFGFLLGIGVLLNYAGSLDYAAVFGQAQALEGARMNLVGGLEWPVLTVACILLFVGAMGKSAQVPLHVWLPDSMEGPTPISALIHAATMVTAGIFMVARMSPLFEFAPGALAFVLVIGATTAFFMGLLGLVQNDIKRVVAYSTLSQLGYMTAALGASAYAAGVFHLVTHAFFKALLFLAAGSVIVGMHHEQDIRRMGGLRRYMPITYWTALLGSLALIGFPGFSGFFSKDAVIAAVHDAHVPGSGYAYWLLLLGVFVTALYSFRMFFLVFHGKERMDHHTRDHLHESPAVITLPLMLLAIPSVVLGWFAIGPLLAHHGFGEAIFVLPEQDSLHHLVDHFEGPWAFVLHGFTTPVVYLAFAGVLAAWWLYLVQPGLPARLQRMFRPIHTVLMQKYYFDAFNEKIVAAGGRLLGQGLWRAGDRALIDGLLVNGSARLVGRISAGVRKLQTGYLYHYAFLMIIGLVLLLAWLLTTGS